MDAKEMKTKCAHPSCRCHARPDSKYCSTYCEGQAEEADVVCSCGHVECTRTPTR